MKKIAFVIIISLISIGSKGQIIHLLEQKPVEELYAKEDSLGSILHKSDFEFGICEIPWDDPNCMKGTVKLKGKIYKRTNEDFLTGLHIWYFSFPKGNVRHVKANWGLYNNSSTLKNSEIIELFKGKEREFVRKYKSIKNELINYLGEPSIKEEIQDNKTRLLKKVKWNYKEKYICLTLVYYRYDENSDIPYFMPIDTNIEIDIYYKSE